MHPLIRFALKNLSKSKARSVLAILAVFLGVLLITALLVLTDSLVATVDDSLEILSGSVIVQEANIPDPTMSLINETVVDRILEQNNTGGALEGDIKAYAKEIWYLEKNNETEFGFAQILGIIPSQEKATIGVLKEENFFAGRTLEDDDVNKTVIGVNTAIALELIPGSIIEVAGVELQVVGIFATDSFLDAVFFVNIDTVRQFRDTYRNGMISTVLIRPVDVAAETRIINYINNELGEIYGIEAADVDELAEQGRQMMEITTDFAFYIGLISVIIGSLSVFNAILMSVSERKREIAVLKATGWKDSEIGFEVFIESIFIGVIGGLIGLGGGVLVAWYVTTLSSYLDLVVIPITLIKSCTYAVFLGVFAGLYPAYRAMMIDPVNDLMG
ncbi:MAG: ABC transporter permease [Candidatus Heimdallarchaeota archaeon]|nr:ABC transporter permease [Candidatus Heimdallarchaeota archaeon]